MSKTESKPTKQTKAMLFIICAIFIIVSVFFIYSIKESDTAIVAKDQSNSSDYQKIIKAQERAVIANELLCSSFNYLSESPYPDDYAGDYISEDGILTIYLTSFENQSNYIDILSDYIDIVNFEHKQHSLNTLDTVAIDLAGKLQTFFSIAGYGSDIINNYVIIDLEDPRTPHNENILSPFLVADDNYYLYPSENEENVQIKINWDTVKTIEESTYPGGTVLNNNSAIATMACNGYRSGTFGFVTCGHSQIIGHMMYAPIDFVGVTSYINYPTTSNPIVYGDFSFINAVSTPSNTISPTNLYKMINNSLYAYVGGLSISPAVGTYLYKYGFMSGASLVQVTQQNYTDIVSLDGGATGQIKGLSVAKIMSGNSLSGDSGGPYVYQNRFCGVHRGSVVPSPDENHYVKFTPYTYMLNQSISLYY